VGSKKLNQNRMTAAEIGNVGERHVEAWLKARNYACNRNTQLPGSTDIEATGSANLLVQVKTAMQPEAPAELSPAEIANIKSRASRTSRQAWLAQVTIDVSGRLIRDIRWTQLN
jgi:hypothetical protein